MSYARATDLFLREGRLVLLGEPFAKLLSDLHGVVVNNFTLGLLLFINYLAIFIFFKALLNLFDYLVSFFVTNVSGVATFVMADMIGYRHKYLIFVHAACGLFKLYQFIGFALKDKHACLDADIWLESIRMQIYRCKNLGVFEYPLAHIT
ncbi:hypothetical protein AW883_27560 [Pseudomonas aeruginosa]|nr:hypothetical protein AW880_27830 [Pseudomonas aeruginosa]KWX33397.1 hypothetical protein AW882_27485 [Pseudomonas aeruginosa]KWX39990.1 hypothetical protein AW883_27560 [Pseudomonas aeruginosa]KWX50786.1 hypothetical protein AW881_26455 [Pseudomonas aeruginosa]KWX51698.1 hypothetical protein AW884_26440 [Pseudomonas aeruginosa]